MDPQVTQQLTQLVQQMLQVLQSAGGGGGGAPDPMGGMDDEDTAPMDKDMGTGGAAPMMDDDDEEMGMGGGGDMMGGASLHDRVQQLESHTGLRKTASSAPLSDRVDALERHWLGEEYDGPMPARVAQLEKSAGITAKVSANRRAQSQRSQQDTAPDVIPLDALIKAATEQSARAAVEQFQRAQQAQSSEDDDDLPSLSKMRKSAQNARAAQYGQPKRQRHQVSSDAELVKAAEMGYGEDELDEPVGLGDLLLAQYRAAKGGSTVFLGDDDD